MLNMPETEREVTPNEEGDRELPGSDLMFRVAGTSNADWFRDSGRSSIAGIDGLLSLFGKSFTDFSRALDFGCGCGRMLLHLEDVGKKIELYGVDIDADAIAWAQQHIPWVRSSVNQGLPPLDFPDEYFDLVFNHSVFTHIDERYQDAWLIELERITKPGGWLVLSVSGGHVFAEFERAARDGNHDPTHYRTQLRDDGFLYIADDGWVNSPFPDFYHTSFHAPWYIFERWGSIFDIKAYIVRGDLDFQDLLLLRRRETRVGIVTPPRRLAWELAQSQERAAALSSEVQQWRTAAEKSAGDLEKVFASRSWRITAPLRNFAARFR
jgi:SAM-dependent methyltransferase